MAPLPHYVNVGPLELEVIADDRATAKLRPHDSDKEVLRGLTMVSEGYIAIDPSMPQGLQAVTLSHELVHAMLDLGAAQLSDKQEEAVCRVLGPALVDLVRDNPEVVAYLRRPGR